MTEPLTPADCDLRGLPFMPLDVVRLVDSDLAALATGDEFKAAVILWCKSWLQVPAASLPDDDRILAHLSGAGARWGRVKAVALRGWVRCADGRLYHPVIAEKARDAWARRQDHHQVREAVLDRKRREREARATMFGALREAGIMLPWNTPTAELRDRHAALVAPVTPPVTPPVTGLSRLGQGQGQGQKEIPESSLRSDSGPAAAPPPAAPLLQDIRSALWTEGLARARRLTGKPDRPARALLGKWLKAASDDCALVAAVLVQAEMDRPGVPEAWIAAAIETRMGRGADGYSTQRGGARAAREVRQTEASWREDIFGRCDPQDDRPIIDMVAEG